MTQPAATGRREGHDWVMRVLSNRGPKGATRPVGRSVVALLVLLTLVAVACEPAPPPKPATAPAWCGQKVTRASSVGLETQLDLQAAAVAATGTVRVTNHGPKLLRIVYGSAAEATIVSSAETIQAKALPDRGTLHVLDVNPGEAVSVPVVADWLGCNGGSLPSGPTTFTITLRVIRDGKLLPILYGEAELIDLG